MRRLSVLEVIDEGSVGGGQQHVLLLAAGLRQRGVDVVVACPAEGYLADRLDAAGIARHPVRMHNRPDPAALAGMVRLCRQRRFDLVHTHGGTAGLWGRIGASLARVPARVHTFHGLHALHQQSGFHRRLLLAVERGLARLTSRVICVAGSDYALASSSALLPAGGGIVIRNGIDLSRFTHAVDPESRELLRTGLGCAAGDLVIGTIGRLHRQKGHEDLVRAMPEVLAACPSCRFVIVGDGELRGEIERLAGALAVSGRLHLAGERVDAPELLQAFDLFVLPSLWEGLPLVLIEAAAAGCAIVATGVDGNREILEGEASAIFVPPADPPALAAALIRAAGDRALRARLGAQARETVLPRFGVDAMVEATLALYRATVTRSGRTAPPESPSQ